MVSTFRNRQTDSSLASAPKADDGNGYLPSDELAMSMRSPQLVQGFHLPGHLHNGVHSVDPHFVRIY